MCIRDRGKAHPQPVGQIKLLFRAHRIEESGARGGAADQVGDEGAGQIGRHIGDTVGCRKDRRQGGHQFGQAEPTRARFGLSLIHI